jgi:transposase-like protein
MIFGVGSLRENSAIIKIFDDGVFLTWNNDGMTKTDIRKMGKESKDFLKRIVLEKVRQGISITQVAREKRINRQLIYAWKTNAVRNEGQKEPIRGRPNFRIYRSQEHQILRILSEKSPHDLGISYPFWNYQGVRIAVSQVIPNPQHITVYQIRKWLTSWGLDRTKEAKGAFAKSFPTTNQMPAIAYAQQNSFRCFYLDYINIRRDNDSYSFVIAVAPRGDIHFVSTKSSSNHDLAKIFLNQLYSHCKNKLLLLYCGYVSMESYLRKPYIPPKSLLIRV